MLRCCREDPGILGRDNSRFSSFGSGRTALVTLCQAPAGLSGTQQGKGPVSTVSGRSSYSTPLLLTPPQATPLQKQAHIRVPRWIPSPSQALSRRHPHRHRASLFSLPSTPSPSLPDQAPSPPSSRFSCPRLPKDSILITQPIRGLLSTLCLPIKDKNSELPKGLLQTGGPKTEPGSPSSRPQTPQGQRLPLSIRQPVHWRSMTDSPRPGAAGHPRMVPSHIRPGAPPRQGLCLPLGPAYREGVDKIPKKSRKMKRMRKRMMAHRNRRHRMNFIVSMQGGEPEEGGVRPPAREIRVSRAPHQCCSL